MIKLDCGRWSPVPQDSPENPKFKSKYLSRYFLKLREGTTPHTSDEIYSSKSTIEEIYFSEPNLTKRTINRLFETEREEPDLDIIIL